MRRKLLLQVIILPTYFLHKTLLYVLFECLKISLLRVVENIKFNNFIFLIPLASYADILSTRHPIDKMTYV